MTPFEHAQHIATWRYDAVRAEPLPHWSAQRLLAIEVCNLIPYGRWCYYQDLALAYNAVVRARDLGYATHNAHTFALMVDDDPDRDAGRIVGITVPWHRMRDINGLLRDKGGPVFDPFDTGNLDWRAEGGRLVGASAGQGQRIDLRREFNDPESEIAIPGA